MFGAILGDMIGAPYEFDMGYKKKEFPLFSEGSHFTDDTVMTIAVCEELLKRRKGSGEYIKHGLVESMQKWGRKYPHAGYGAKFKWWLKDSDPKPYGSYGNGSAMRVSSAGWLYDSIEDTRKIARLTAEVSHNHPEGIKGAEAVASAIFLARTGHSKAEIKEYIIEEFKYDLSKTCDEIRPYYHHDESCQRTVPEAITAFLEGSDFEDVIRTAVSLGGDCDTLTCIAGSIAEAFYGVPDKLRLECRKRLPEDLREVLNDFATEISKNEVEVILLKEGLKPEPCMVSVLEEMDDFIAGKLLQEPRQGFGYHRGETIGFFAHVDDKGKSVYLCDMNPNKKLKYEDLEDGSMLENAIHAFNTDRTQDNFFEILELLRDSYVWIPCNAILSEDDEKMIIEMLESAGDDLEKLKGQALTTRGDVRMVPDILEKDGKYYFPVFSTAEAMGEYGGGFSKIEKHFFEAMCLAKNNDRDIAGIVVNAFTESFVLDAELFDVVENLKSRIVEV